MKPSIMWLMEFLLWYHRFELTGVKILYQMKSEDVFKVTGSCISPLYDYIHIGYISGILHHPPSKS